MANITGYELSRCWFDFSFENPELVSPEHTAIFFFAIEHCNRLGWKEKFGFPTQMVIDAIGIKKASTYIKYFNDLVDWEFFILIQKSKNQHSANIISFNPAMPKNGKALGKAIHRHLEKHLEKQPESTGKSTWKSKVPINKLVNSITSKPVNNETGNSFFDKIVEDFRTIEECVNISLYDERWVRANKTNENELLEFNKLLEKRSIYEKVPIDYKTHFANWKMSGKKDDFMKFGNTNMDDAAKGQQYQDEKSRAIING